MLQSVTFDLLADSEPGALPRIIGAFARRDLAVDQFRARRFGDAVQVTIGLDAIPAMDLVTVEGSLRQIVGVRRVEVVLRSHFRAVA